MTVGEEEDEKAFEEVLRQGWIDAEKLIPAERDWLRLVWDAGVKRGQELRGCCEERDA